jgi:regulation of enolase protein 1 (concanavalin A-like superfamily)
MKFTFYLILVLILDTLCFQVVAQDNIKIPGLQKSWKWINKPAGHSVKENEVAITATKGTDQYVALDGKYESNNAPKLLFAADKDFIFSAKLSTPFDSLYDGGAILLYSDAGNYAKLLFEKAEATSIMVTSSVINQKQTDDNYHIAVKGTEVYLKVATSGKTICFYYSTDGTQWNIVRTFAFKQRSTMKLGFYAQSPLGPSCTVSFSEIKYSPTAFKNFNTGE